MWGYKSCSVGITEQLIIVYLPYLIQTVLRIGNPALDNSLIQPTMLFIHPIPLIISDL